MEPYVAEILSENEKNPSAAVVEAGSRGTWISWLLKYLPPELQTAERIGIDQMLVSSIFQTVVAFVYFANCLQVGFASIHTVS
jgi:hypothetical protein